MTMAPSHRPTAIVAAALAFIMLAALLSEAQIEPTAAGAPGPAAEDCITVLYGAADCLSYVQEGSNLTVPEKPCCGEIRDVVKNHPDCLCQMLAKNNSIGIEFDVNKALKLPSICHVSTPPISLCSLIGVPVAVPTGAPPPSSGSDASSSLSPGVSTPGGGAPGPTGGATTNGHLCGLASLVGTAMALLPFVFAF